MVSKELKEKIALAYRVCQNCGLLYGNGFPSGKKQATYSTWLQESTCDICMKKTETTEFRDFGFARNEFVETN